MLKRNKILFSIIAVLFLIQAGLLFLLWRPAASGIVLRTFYESPNFINSFYSFGQKEIPQISNHIYAGIVPHHLIVGDKIAAFYGGLSKENYQTVILLSPDHFNMTPNKIIIGDADWQTPYGLLKNDDELARKISSSTGAEYYYGDARLQHEHSINYELPFIKRSFPKVKIVAIIMKKNIVENDLDKLAMAIEKNTQPDKVLLLVSTDFSHDASAAVAEDRDAVSNKIIGYLKLAEYENIQSDCPSALYVAMKYSADLNLKPRLIWHTNSGILIGKPEENSTSHNFYYFGK
jgi:AmmeMemoRadiSam system protein B